MRKITETKSSLIAIISRILAQSCVAPPYIFRHMIVLVSLIAIRELLVPMIFCMVHPNITIHSVELLV